jgi:hypothetical protein
VYTPVVPCRIVDTRSVGGAFAAGGQTRNYRAYLTAGTFTVQGGAASNCGIPANPAAVALNITAINGGSFLTAWPYNTTMPTSSTLNPAAGLTLANGAIIATCQPNCAAEFSVFTFGAHVVIDIAGYFKAPVGAVFSGNVGIGANPVSGRLHVEGGVNNAVYGHSTNGIGVYGTSTLYEGVRGEASDVNHGGVVGVHNGGGIGVFGTSTGVGVQGTSAAGKGVVGTSTSGTGVYGQTAGAGITTPGVYGVATSVGGIGLIGEANNSSSVGVFGVSGSATGFGIYARNTFGGRAFYAEGNATQGIDYNGMLKAMVEMSVDSIGAAHVLDRCFNGVTNSSSGNCGFTITEPIVGVARINFGFPIANRFFSVSPRYTQTGNSTNNTGANYRRFDANTVEVFTFVAGNSADTQVRGFTLLVH